LKLSAELTQAPHSYLLSSRTFKATERTAP
jgi:hypothetical protein